MKTLSETVLLESKKIKLFKDRLVDSHNGENTYYLKDMEKADLKRAGFFSPPRLLIYFKNGEVKEFAVTTKISGSAQLDLLFTDSMASMNAEILANVQHWVETLNTLILRPLPDMIYCKYCGAKNKSSDSKCIHCGAILA